MLRRADGVADSYIIDASIRTLTAQACRKVLILIDTCLRGAQVASIHNTSVNTCELVRRDSAWDDKGHAKAQSELRNIDVVTAGDEPAATQRTQDRFPNRNLQRQCQSARHPTADTQCRANLGGIFNE